jgi:hypothetical protein
MLNVGMLSVVMLAPCRHFIDRHLVYWYLSYKHLVYCYLAYKHLVYWYVTNKHICKRRLQASYQWISHLHTSHTQTSFL